MGRRVLIVDCDPQANATSGLGVARDDVQTSIYDVVVLGQPIAEARIPSVVPNLDLVPSHISLAGSDIELVGMPLPELRLRYALPGLDHRADSIFLDCPPS